jgi:hypothetical protein
MAAAALTTELVVLVVVLELILEVEFIRVFSFELRTTDRIL